MTDELEQRVEVSEEQVEPEAAVAEEGVEPAAESLPEERLHAEVSDELASLQQELETARAKEAEYLDGWQRSRAELSNARKRFQREQEQAYQNAKADMLARLLPVVDDLERAFSTLPEELSGLAWVEGVSLIQNKLQALLEQEGVTAIEATGQEFDPIRHEAVTHEPSVEVAEGHIIAEVQKGYKVADRVLRPSAVRVSAGPPPEPVAEAEQEEMGETVVE